MAIYIAGDIHGPLEIYKLNNKYFPEQSKLRKSDYVIILGDFGLIFDDSKHEKALLKELRNRKFTTLFIDGNHENFNMLNSYPIIEWSGGNVHKINESIYHLMRGQVFTLQDNKFFTFGGGRSEDVEYRVEHISWWREEIPNNHEMELGIRNLEKVNNEVDFILTHTCSSSTLGYIAKKEKFKVYSIDITCKYLEKIKEVAKYKRWYFGHYHSDYNINSKETVVYKKIVKILD